MVIAIDGPAGAGKSTISKIVAQRLGFLYIDTGAMYRAVTLKALEEKIDIGDIPALVRMLDSTAVDLSNNPDGTLRVLLDGRDVTRLIRQPVIGQHVSLVAKIKEVRQAMVKIQRKLGTSQDSVLDGRDIGTVVFPKADKKFYLDAALKERALRRYKELQESGQLVTIQEVEEGLQSRDTIDSTREIAPLKKADDAILIDTTLLTIDQVVDTIMSYIG